MKLCSIWRSISKVEWQCVIQPSTAFEGINKVYKTVAIRYNGIWRQKPLQWIIGVSSNWRHISITPQTDKDLARECFYNTNINIEMSQKWDEILYHSRTHRYSTQPAACIFRGYRPSGYQDTSRYWVVICTNVLLSRLHFRQHSKTD